MTNKVAAGFADNIIRNFIRTFDKAYTPNNTSRSGVTFYKKYKTVKPDYLNKLQDLLKIHTAKHNIVAEYDFDPILIDLGYAAVKVKFIEFTNI